MHRLPCRETEDGFHIAEGETLRVSLVKHIGYETIAVVATCTACGSIGTVDLDLDALAWAAVPAAEAAILAGGPKLTLIRGDKGNE